MSLAKADTFFADVKLHYFHDVQLHYFDDEALHQMPAKQKRDYHKCLISSYLANMPKQQNQVIGSFVIRDEGDGCLFIKYHHGDSPQSPFAEAAKLISTNTPEDIFAGSYRTVWIEDGFNSVVADLIIDRNTGNSNLFQLSWNVVDSDEVIFEGTAMLYQDLLIGAYWD